MIFSRRIVFYRNSGPRTSPLSGIPLHDFLVAYCVFTRILSRVPAIKWNTTSHVSPRARVYGFQCARLSAQGGPTLAHLLAETIPEFPTAVKKVIPLFCSLFLGAIIKWDRPILPGRNH